MKVAFIILVCAAHALANIHSQCPSDYSIEKLIPHEECNKYYQCTHGYAIQQTCSEGLYFNIDTQLCDYYDNVDCSGRDGVPGPKCVCPEDWSKELIFAHADCSKYYQCYNGNALERECSPGLFFEPGKLWCDWPDSVNCDREIVCPDPSEGNPAPGPEGEKHPDCPEDWSIEPLLPHPNCNQFYRCSEGLAYPLECPAGLKYDIALQRCEWAQTVDCTGRN